MGGELSIMYGVVWQTLVDNGPPYSTLFKALTVTKYLPSENKKVTFQVAC